MRKGRGHRRGAIERNVASRGFDPVRPGPQDLRAYPEDRAGGGLPKSSSGKRERIEPTLGRARGSLSGAGEAKASAKPRGRGRGSRGAGRTPRALDRRSARLLVLRAGVSGSSWAGRASSPIMPASCRPSTSSPCRSDRPNIAIVGEDGTQLVNRGDTGGAAVRLRDLPPLSAQGLRGHRGSPLLQALGHRPPRHQPGDAPQRHGRPAACRAVRP